MNAPLAFLDTETTGLHPEVHQVWEVGLVVRRDGADREHVWQLPVDLSTADLHSLDIGRFWERRWPDAATGGTTTGPHDLDGDASRDRPRSVVPQASLGAWCDLFVRLTHGCRLVGNVISFDAERLGALLRRERRTPTWHHHLIDVVAVAAGRLGVEPPWSSDDISESLGVTVADDDRHTALGDARWARDLYDAALGTGPAPDRTSPADRASGPTLRVR